MRLAEKPDNELNSKPKASEPTVSLFGVGPHLTVLRVCFLAVFLGSFTARDQT